MDRVGKGCYQSHEKVKIFLKLFLIISIFIIISTNITIGCKIATAQTGSSRIVIEASSKVVLSGDNIHERLPMASTTKIVTAIVAIEHCDIEQVVTIPKEAEGVEGSSIYLKAGEKLKLIDLLYGLMLRSGNDSAVAIALHVGKSMDNFVQMMNDYAAGLGLNDTHFTNPHGLHDDDHYTSAYDLAIMTARAYENECFKQIVSCKRHDTQAIEETEQRIFYNKNKMLSIYEGGNGVKTGFTKRAGRCLVSAAERDGMQLICVVLNRADMWGESMSLMDNVFAKYTTIKFAESGKPIFTLPSGIRIAADTDVSYPIYKSADISLSYEFICEENIQLPLSAGSKAGVMNVYGDNQLIFSTDLYTMDNISSDEQLDYLRHYVGDWQVEYDGKTKQIFGIVRDGVPS
ncbi:MAG: D-alanyl-D-alanine carboxypeptidase [Clostridia bacterium]|nr:D-alanyl-D-alanine carboxypeptidase [Clostridia bacterium]